MALASLLVVLAGCRVTIELDPETSLGACHPVGSVCAMPTECCTAACDGGFCVALDGCLPAGESCAAGADCCSHVCASDGEGRVLCQQLGGCRVAGELCAEDRECCGGATCAAIDSATGIGRCALGAVCGGAGEVCRASGDPAAMRECCAGLGPRIQCRAGDVRGVDRCLVASGECAPEGESCAAPSDCCAGRCVPDALGVLACRVACSSGAGRCTSDADCCSGACGLGAHCESTPRTCSALAEACQDSAECCSGLCEDDVCGSPLF